MWSVPISDVKTVDIIFNSLSIYLGLEFSPASRICHVSLTLSALVQAAARIGKPHPAEEMRGQGLGSLTLILTLNLTLNLTLARSVGQPVDQP